MTVIKCPFCGEDVEIDLTKALDEEGEVYKCPHCGKLFRFAQ